MHMCIKNRKLDSLLRQSWKECCVMAVYRMRKSRQCTPQNAENSGLIGNICLRVLLPKRKPRFIIMPSRWRTTEFVTVCANSPSTDDYSSMEEITERVKRSSPKEHKVSRHRQWYHTKNGVEWRERTSYSCGGKRD